MELLKQFPYFEGKTVLYVHGFGSSGQSNTPRLLQQMMPQAEVVAPDLPVQPEEALGMLQSYCREAQPAVIVGTSMGGMYAEMLYGYDRILVNPAFNLHETLRTNVGLGRVTFFNPRRDGVQEFMLTKSLLEEYKAVTLRNFSHAEDEEEQARVFGLFGRHDPMVHTAPLFRQHYRQAITFEGEHRLNDSILLHAVMPILNRIDQRQTGREQPAVFIHTAALFHPDGREISEARHAFEWLSQHYDVHILAPAGGASPWPVPAHADDESVEAFLERTFGAPAWGRVLRTDSFRLLYGDYLVAPPHPCSDADSFLGTFLPFGSEKFRTWEDTMSYFSLLGGQ